MISTRSWRRFLRRIKVELMALYLVSQEPRVPWILKLFVIGIVVYAVSPIDLIPDFIPIIGYLDDLLLLPLCIWIVLQLIPKAIMQDCRLQAVRQLAQSKTEITQPRWRIALMVGIIILFWVGIIGLIFAFFQASTGTK
jgi:uncharacterized membrane protein YkvA (DUF1232 family)